MREGKEKKKVKRTLKTILFETQGIGEEKTKERKRHRRLKSQGIGEGSKYERKEEGEEFCQQKERKKERKKYHLLRGQIGL